MLEQAFTVLTEFKFEVGEAVLNTNQLTSATDKLSQSATNAMNSIQYAAASIVTSFTGATGVLGVLYAAVQASDKYAKTQIAMANTLTQPGETFASAMERSAQAMEQIEKISKQFSLPAEDLMNITKLLGPMLQVHGLAGYNYSNAIQLGRKFLKASPMLGIDSSQAMGELQNIVSGHAYLQNTVFRRLTAETPAMAKYNGNAGAFNALPDKERLRVLNAALEKFTSNTAAINAQAHTFSGEIQRLKTSMYGAFSIFRQVGDYIMKPVLQVLKTINDYLDKNGKQIMANIGRMIDPWTHDASGFLATLYQIKHLKHDIANTSHLLGAIATLLFAHEILGYLGVSIPIVTTALSKFAGMMEFFTGAIGAISIEGPAGGLLGFLDGLVVIISDLLAPIALLVGFFQLLSRAFFYAKEFAAKNIAEHMTQITQAMANFSGLVGIFMDGFDLIARGLGHILDPTQFLGFINLVEIGVDVLNALTAVLAAAVMGFEGIAQAIMEFFVQIKSYLTGGGFDKKAIAAAFNYGMQDVYDKVYGKVKEKDGGTMNQQVNMDVKMENHFKEMLEPDRVAFTIKDQLLKAAQNKTTAVRQGFALTGGSRN